jgi:hypothetical protein
VEQCRELGDGDAQHSDEAGHGADGQRIRGAIDCNVGEVNFASIGIAGIIGQLQVYNGLVATPLPVLRASSHILDLPLADRERSRGWGPG